MAAHLLQDGWDVRALTRDPSSKAAQELADKGATIIQGNMENRDELNVVMQDVYGVFSVQPPVWDLPAIEEKVRLGMNVADVAKLEGVQHLVYSSISGAEAQSRFRPVAKWEVEKYIRGLNLPATILRFTFFMENYVSPYSPIRNGTYAEAIAHDIPVNLIAVDDIGAFVNIAFQEPATFIGKTMEMAGDSLTPPELAAVYSRAAGQSIVNTHFNRNAPC